MASISKIKLSGSTDGKLIPVTTGGVTVHTAVSGTANWDEVHIYAGNYTGTDATLTVSYAGDSIVFVIPGQVGLIEIVPNLLLNNGGTITATASTNSALNVGGFVNRITA